MLKRKRRVRERGHNLLMMPQQYKPKPHSQKPWLNKPKSHSQRPRPRDMGRKFNLKLKNQRPLSLKVFLPQSIYFLTCSSRFPLLTIIASAEQGPSNGHGKKVQFKIEAPEAIEPEGISSLT